MAEPFRTGVRLLIMQSLRGCLLIVFAAATTLRADSLSDLKTAVASLRGTASIRATLELQRVEVDRSKKPAQTVSGNAAVDASMDAEGLHVTHTPALLARVAKEQSDRETNSELHAPTAGAVENLGPLPIAEHLDFGRRLFGILNRSEFVSEKRVVFEGHSARLLSLKVKTPTPKTSIGHVEILEDSLTIWIGDDNIPLAATRTERYSGGILFIKGEGSQNSRWTFTRKDDRLVATRTEEKSSSSGFGQNSEETEIVTVIIR